MTGPEHYLRGAELLAESEGIRTDLNPDKCSALAVQAVGHFLAALVATTALHQHPESVAWDQAVNPKEQR
ncbi:hypothetical protein [Streptomyces sp. NPDC085596]|uniref:hypothetical protein n=1 Tax=Streptomyces sp. NPDC085596 TaxID=3365731 RepID=UPI0037D3B87E